MLVELYESNGYWYAKDTSGMELTTGLMVGTNLKEYKCKDDKIKTVKKLKEAGFTADEIIDFFNSGVFK